MNAKNIMRVKDGWNLEEITNRVYFLFYNKPHLNKDSFIEKVNLVILKARRDKTKNAIKTMKEGIDENNANQCQVHLTR